MCISQAFGKLVKEAIRAAGGVPFEFNTIGVDDGIAMGHIGMKYSLPSRELIADCVETMVEAHRFDGMVCIPNCDKIVPGMLMAAMRVDIPTIFVSGGPMAAGKLADGRSIDLISIFEGVGAYQAGKIDDRELLELEQQACPTCGSCSGMFTANSMNCLMEALGMALPGNGSYLATSEARQELVREAGRMIMRLIDADLTPRQDRQCRVHRQCFCPGYGYGWFDQHSAAYAGIGAGSRGRVFAGAYQPGSNAHTTSLQSQPIREVAYGRC